MLSFEKYAKKKGLLCKELEDEPDYDEYYSYKENLSFEDYVLITEKLYGNTGWVFHRTETNPEKSVLLSQGIKHGKNKSAFYGTGLYTTYSLDSQLNTDMIRKYGRYIMKGKVNMSGFVIFEPSIFYVVYPGNKNFYKYIRSLGVSHDDFFEYYEISGDRPVIMKEGKQSSDVAKKYWQIIKLKGYNGMIFEGRQDGKVAVIWNRRNFIPYAYAESQPFGAINDPTWISDWKSLKVNYSKILSKKKYKYDDDSQTEKVKFIPTKKSNRVEKKVRDKGGIEYNEYDSFGRIIHQLVIERKAGLPDDIWEQWEEYDSEGNYTYRKLNKKNISTEHWYFANSADDAKKFIKIVHPASKKPWLNIPKHYKVSDIKDGYISKDEELNSWYKSEVKESLSFAKYIILEGKVNIPMERAYELFKAEYDKATGQSWTYQKFLQRAGNWEFYGDMDGFVAIRKQNSGFVKFVGMAGSMKSKYKGFKEVVALGLPLWAMVSKEIADMCKKTGIRSPNALEMFAIKKVLLNNPAIMGDAKVLSYLKDGGVEIQYPDIGRTIKYFVATPAYYIKARKMLIKM